MNVFEKTVQISAENKVAKVDSNDLLLLVVLGTSLLLIFFILQTLKKTKKGKLSDVVKSTL